jgi:hypothetical protein
VDSAEQAIFMVQPETTPVLLWIGPMVKGRLNGLPIPVPFADRASEGPECELCFEATVTSYLLPLATEVTQEMEGTRDPFPFLKIPIPTAHPSVKNVIMAIGVHWPITLEQGRHNPRIASLVIPLPFPNSCARHAAVEAERSNVARGVRRAHWLGPDHGASSNIPETRETGEDQNHSGQSSQTMNPKK